METQNTWSSRQKTLESGSGRLGVDETLDANLLVCWHRAAPAWREIHPLTPARQEIMEPSLAADCTLSSCAPNLFHSLIRGFCAQEAERVNPPRWDDVHAPAVTRLSRGIYIVRCFLSPSVERRILGRVWVLNNVQSYACKVLCAADISIWLHAKKQMHPSQGEERLLLWKEKTAVSRLG